MQKRENLLYVGIDLHKESHTAVMVNCWNEKLEVVVIENKPSEIKKLAEKVNKKSNHLGLEPIYGLENAYGYGRSLAVWLIEKGYIVKDINPALAYDQGHNIFIIEMSQNFVSVELFYLCNKVYLQRHFYNLRFRWLQCVLYLQPPNKNGFLIIGLIEFLRTLDSLKEKI